VSVTVIVPSIPIRAEMLSRAVASVALQTQMPDEIMVRIANDRMSAPRQRDAMLEHVTTEWVAPLDDDDRLYKNHLAELLGCAHETGADIVYPWFDVVGGTDPFPECEGMLWNNDHPHQVPITALFRTELLQDLGGWSEGWDELDPEAPGADPDGNRAGEDYRLILAAVKAGAEIVHLPLRTWAWYHHGVGKFNGNTMGLPSRWGVG
jgi:hypothetical protein